MLSARLLRSERFLAIEAASGILLLATAAIALAWANSPWQGSYRALWHAPLGIEVGSFAFERDLHFWINDGMMTLFFFVVGLEIRREMHSGELSELRRAALPLAAALGGMLIPACLFAGFNLGRESLKGWGIPMATDIAFAVGVLTLLGSRVPPALRILLLALAVIDDVGAILVIAIFYSSGLEPVGFVVLGAGLIAIRAMQVLGVRSPWAYVPPSAVVWAGAYAAGIHPTLAGVVVGLMTPVRAWFGRDGFIEHASASVAAVREHEDGDERALLPHLEHLNKARREAVSPVERLQHALHGWVAFGAMPLFALANAGVSFGNASFAGDSLLVFLGVAVGLVLGKPLGILAFSWLAIAPRLGSIAARDHLATGRSRRRGRRDRLHHVDLHRGARLPDRNEPRDVESRHPDRLRGCRRFGLRIRSDGFALDLARRGRRHRCGSGSVHRFVRDQRATFGRWPLRPR